MGIAAYNRGTALIRREADERFLTRNNLEVIERINGYRKGSAKLFQPTVIRPDSIGKGWLLMNRKYRGYGESCLRYETLKELMSEWDITVTGYGADAHSWYLHVR